MKIKLSELKVMIKSSIQENLENSMKPNHGPKVFVAISALNYEGSNVIGVAKSHKGAERLCKEYEANGGYFDNLLIKEYELVD